ncbi:hypothetical protein V866_001840 [Kwoniella sp. B9012]
MDETAGQSKTQTGSAETERFDEYGTPSATGYTIDEMLQRFRQWCKCNKTGMDLNEMPDDQLYEMMTNHLHRKRNTHTGQGDDEWELPSSKDRHPAAWDDEEEKQQAAELNSYIGLPPPYQGQSALSRRSKTERHPTRGVTTRVGVRKNWDYELEIKFPEETIWANSPTGVSTDIHIPPTTIIYEISKKGLSAEGPKEWLASLTIPQVIDKMLPHIPMEEKIARWRSAMSMAQDWRGQQRREYFDFRRSRGHPSRRGSKATFPPPPKFAAPRAPPFCPNCGEPDCWGC